ncbi:MAG: HEAT repeat domain-containing protein [Anaerolineae bacterium]
MFSGTRSLSRALRQKNPQKRQEAVAQLVKMGPEAGPILQRALADRRYWTREAAIQAYQDMGEAAIPLLIVNLNRSPAISRKSHELLITFPAGQTIPYLLQALQGRRGRLAWKAANILIDIGGRVAAPMLELLQSAGTRRAVRRRADYVLSRIYSQHTRSEAQWLVAWLLGSLLLALLGFAAGETILARLDPSALPVDAGLLLDDPLRAQLLSGYLLWAVGITVALLMYRAMRKQRFYPRGRLVLGRHLLEEVVVLLQIVLLTVAGSLTPVSAIIAPAAAVYLGVQAVRLLRGRRAFERKIFSQSQAIRSG